jgi:MoaA/NifB/PqqE/SkfB family radical SAM enzyme
MTPELREQYKESAKPFIDGGGGAITERIAAMNGWRIFLEINSGCNLACPTCTKGNMGATEGLKYEHQTGIMDWELMEKCLDKIKIENSEAIVLLYGNSEPFLHPRLGDCVRAVHSRGLNCQISSNLNYIRNVEDVIASNPDLFLISLSGFTQDVYVKGHAGGNIEKVLANMRIVAAEYHRQGATFDIRVNYHVYKDNAHEVDRMKDFCKNIGIGFFTSYARAISMENAIQYCRSKDPEATQFEVQEGRPDWNHLLPPIGKTYVETMDRLKIPPTKAVEMYADIPVSLVCPVGAGSLFTFIRHDGKVQLCACTADHRIVLGDYLKTSPEELIEQRTGHAICKQCIKMRLNHYFHLSSPEKWNA